MAGVEKHDITLVARASMLWYLKKYYKITRPYDFEDILEISKIWRYKNFLKIMKGCLNLKFSVNFGFKEISGKIWKYLQV